MHTNKRWSLAAVAMIGLTAATVGQASNDEDMWYATPLLQAIWLDSDRDREDSYGAGVAFGLTLADRWNLEAIVARAEHDGPASSDLTIETAGLAVQRIFNPGARTNPYLFLGAGFARSEPRFETMLDDGSTDPYVELGLGLLHDLAVLDAGARKLQLRGEIKGRRVDESVRSDNIDYIALVGVQYAWGGPAKTVTQPVAEPLPPPPSPPADSDGDGVIDPQDRCAGTPAGVRVDTAGCPLDTDADGVLNADDRCPDTARGARVDVNGCPFTDEIRLEHVYFDTDRAVLRPESRETLDYAVNTLKRNADLTIEVAGHTDSRASHRHNEDLSQRRAQAVMQYLRDHGVTNALTAHGYGESQPIDDNETEAGRQRNRRVTLRVVR